MTRQGLISASGVLTRRGAAVGNHRSTRGPYIAYICHDTNPIFRGLGPVANRKNRILKITEKRKVPSHGRKGGQFWPQEPSEDEIESWVHDLSNGLL